MRWIIDAMDHCCDGSSLLSDHCCHDSLAKYNWTAQLNTACHVITTVF